MALLCYAMLLCPEAPIDRAPHSSVPWAVVGYALYALTVGLHSLAFSKCIALLGIVPTAVATGGVQQAASIVLGDVFCGLDAHRCFTDADDTSVWGQGRKTIGITLCCIGSIVYLLDRTPHRDTSGSGPARDSARASLIDP